MMENIVLQETITKLTKNYGNGIIKTINDLPQTKDNVVSTGIVGLDIALGVGGIRKGSIVEIYAPESTGKTTLALHLCKQYQSDKPVLYIDTERTLTREIIETMGLKENSFYLMYADNLEMALDVCKTSALSGSFGAIVIDSLAGLVPKAQIDGDVGDSHVGLFSRIMSDTLPILTPILDNSGTTLIIINQIREKVGVMFGNPEKTTGGRALKYYVSVRLDMRMVETIKQNGVVIGKHVRVKVVKNKIATPYKEAEFDIMFGHGISIESDILDRAVEKGVITKQGYTKYFYRDKQIGDNKENAKEYLKNHSTEVKKITNQLRKIYQIA